MYDFAAGYLKSYISQIISIAEFMRVDSLRYISMVLFICILYTACKKEGGEDKPASPKQNVYVAGSINDHAAYWENGEAHYLEDTTNLIWSYAICIYPSGNDVFVCGAKDIDGYRYAMYWKNGIATYLRRDSMCYASSIITSGNDVYVAGALIFNPPHMNPEYTKAVYWKNGEMYYLLKDSSYANRMAVSGTDLYITGGEVKNGITRGVLWKNGIATYLGDSTINTYLADVVVVGTDVYVGGTQMVDRTRTALYWKNGVLYNTGQLMNVQSMYVSGNDVYLVGDDYSSAYPSGKYIYCKNGVASMLPDHYSAFSIFASGNDVYIAGVENKVSSPFYDLRAVIRKNGQPYWTSPVFSSAYSVVIK